MSTPTLSDDELLRLAEAATQFEGAWYLQPELEGFFDPTDAALVAAASPSRIKSLLSEKAELEREVRRMTGALFLMPGWRRAIGMRGGKVVWEYSDDGSVIDGWEPTFARQALSPNNPAGQAMEGDHG